MQKAVKKKRKERRFKSSTLAPTPYPPRNHRNDRVARLMSALCSCWALASIIPRRAETPSTANPSWGCRESDKPSMYQQTKNKQIRKRKVSDPMDAQGRKTKTNTGTEIYTRSVLMNPVCYRSLSLCWGDSLNEIPLSLSHGLVKNNNLGLFSGCNSAAHPLHIALGPFPRTPPLQLVFRLDCITRRGFHWSARWLLQRHGSEHQRLVLPNRKEKSPGHQRIVGCC